MGTTLERKFQASVIKGIKKQFPGSIILKTDPGYKQGIPDLLVLYKSKWAALECKRSKTAKKQPNQDYYIQKMDKMSFARFIYPENKKEVLDDLQHTFRPSRPTRSIQSKPKCMAEIRQEKDYRKSVISISSATRNRNSRVRSNSDRAV